MRLFTVHFSLSVPRQGHHLIWMMCFFCVVAVMSMGCSGQQKKDDSILRQYEPPGRTTMRVKELTISGLTTLDEDELRGGLATQEDPGWRTTSWISWMPLIGAEKVYFNEVSWRQDQQRIRTWLMSKGYYSASLATSSSRTKDGQWISLSIKIAEKKPVRIERIEVVGLEGTPYSVSSFELGIKQGSVFEQKVYLSAKDKLRRALRQRSYAYAQVQGDVLVNPKTRKALVTMFVDLGPKTYIEGVKILGLQDVTKSYVEEAITLVKGQPYSDKALLKTQENIYALGVFSLVTVRPAFELNRNKPQRNNEQNDVVLKDGELGPLGISEVLRLAHEQSERRYGLNPKIKVFIRVKEAKKLTVRLGTGFSVESTRQDLHLSANWASRNLFGTLLRLEHFNTFGYAITPGLIGLAFDDDNEDDESFGETIDRVQDGIGNNGFFFDSQLSMTKPQFLLRSLEGFIAANFKREVQLGYLGISPSASIGLRRTFFEHLKVEASYSLLYYRYQSLDAGFRQRLIEQELIQRDEENPSQFLESFEQRIAYDRRNNILNPTSGFMVELFLQQAGDYIAGGNFKYLKPKLSIEGYIPYTLGTRWVTALRSRVGSIYNLNDAQADGVSRGIPVQSRYFAGGRNSQRSFGTRFLSPFTDNTLMVDPDTFDPVPVGGTTLLEASIEQRARVVKSLLGIGDLWAAFYLDAGTVLEEPLFFDTSGNQQPLADTARLTDTLIYSAGGGMWWLTPVGPVRFDLAFTLSDITDHPNYQSPQVRQKILGYNFYIGIGHSF